tara:strand:- start:11375 stop:12490 length:1116 start_codon:yes stop_codon:yes gene_type:complete
METPNQKKDKAQREAANEWVKAGFFGTIEAATAFGKTRLGIMIISHYAKKANYEFKALIVAPTVAIQAEWKKEFKKWGENRVLIECVEIYCINTARDFEQEYYDIGVFDEIHNYVNGEINSKIFHNNKFEKILGLSASIDDAILHHIEKIAPICYTLNVYDALELGLISEFTIYNIGVNLTDWELKQYQDLTNSINYAREKFKKTAWGKIGQRKSLIYKAANKLKVIQEIADHFKGKYGIVFSQTKDYANLVQKSLGETCVPHHSGLGKKSRVANLNKFADGRTKIKEISSAKTLDEGVTLPRLEWGVIATGSSKEKQMIQRVGRLLRLDIEGKHAVMFRLYSRNTVEESWLYSAQKGFKIIDINSVKDIL